MNYPNSLLNNERIYQKIHILSTDFLPVISQSKTLQNLKIPSSDEFLRPSATTEELTEPKFYITPLRLKYSEYNRYRLVACQSDDRKHKILFLRI